MGDLLPFVVSGIALGAVYGLAATGLVLTYKTSGIFNFGHGAVATAAAFVFYWLTKSVGLGTGLALIVSVLVVGPGLGLAMEAFARKLAPRPTALKIVGTVGLILLVQGLAALKFGTMTIPMQQFLPGADKSFQLAGVVITLDKVIITAVAVLAVGVLYLFFRSSRTGLAMRAVVDDPDLLAMQAVDPRKVRRIAWIIGATFASLSGVLITPLVGLDAILLTFMVVQAFAGAAIGGFANIPLTLAGGIVVGVLSAVANQFALGHTWLTGLPASVPFLILFVVLLVRGRRLVSPTRSTGRLPEPYRAPGPVRIGTALVLFVPLLLLPAFAGDNLTFFTTGLATGILLLSLGLLVRMSGQVSLCHAAFAAVGAVAFSQFALHFQLPWLVAVLLGSLVAVPVGAVVAIPAIRLSGLFLALATFGFGILVQQLFYPQKWMFTTFSQGREMPHPSFAEDPASYYYVVLGALVLTAISVVAIQRSRLGRLLRVLADSPRSAEALGLTTQVVRVTVFCLSAFFAGLAGILLGVERNFATGGDPFFGSFNSLLLLAMLALAPFAEPWYAIVAVVATVIPAYVVGSDTTFWLNVVFGLSAIFVSMSGGNPTMPAWLRARFDRLRLTRKPPETGKFSNARRAARSQPGDPGIEVVNVGIRFGGLIAVEALSLDAPAGKITGVIGPNGAGKTSTFDACSGFNRKITGRIRLFGEDVTRYGPAARARRRLGRTFQTSELCDSLTVLENIAMGYEAGRGGINPLRQLLAKPDTAKMTRDRALWALHLCGLADLATVNASDLSTGQRRLVELARCLAGDFEFLLLDEPSAGLDADETEKFGSILLEIVRETGLGILLIEHDMSLVMRVCSRIYVMDSGKLIFEGMPSAVADSEVVRVAYLGSSGLVADQRQLTEVSEGGS
ncbi:ATP-binding cassette domain-containing protein [Kribbella sp. NBC_01484]|uniref:ABC transporter permease subunit n=1 Tax=Kribbella sp. NBC_01484 TaxID=2903579 RepID=UPI002E330BD9|nr:ATP-binding cassette domain-containing protein [Kribbella sp. NBC_01484]